MGGSPVELAGGVADRTERASQMKKGARRGALFDGCRRAYASSASTITLLRGAMSIASTRSSRAITLSTLAMWRSSMVKLKVMYSRPGQKVQMLAAGCQAPQ